MKLAKFTLLTALAVALTNVQEGLAATNVALVANIALTGFRQTQLKAAPVRITTQDILNALSKSAGLNLDRNAQLIFLSNDDQLPTVWVREPSGTNETLTDVSGFFTINQPLEVDANHNLQSYSIREFIFDDQQGTSFDVSGLTSMNRTRITSRGVGPLQRVATANAQVNGSATINGETAVLRGTINAGFPKVEITPD